MHIAFILIYAPWPTKKTTVAHYWAMAHRLKTSDLQRSLKIYEKTSLDIGSDMNVATTLNNIGMCLADGLDYLQQPLKIYEKTSLDIASDQDVADTLNNIGLCLIKLHKFFSYIFMTV